MARIHLVDASPYVFRAYYSLPDSLTAPDGRPVNAVYGFAMMLLKLIDDEEVTRLAAGFDGSLTTSFRNEIYPEYKAQREKPPEDLERQFFDASALVEALGFPYFVSDRYESEDLLGSLVDPLVDEGHEVVLVSSDKDLAQLVSDDVVLFDFARDERLDPEGVRQRFGVPPHLVADFLGLAGDSVDNIPGVPGIGKKSAQAILNGIGPLEEVYADLDRVEELEVRGAGSMRRKLEEHREQAEMSKRLATIARDAPVDADAGHLRWEGADRDKLEELLEDLGFGDRIRDRIQRWR